MHRRANSAVAFLIALPLASTAARAGTSSNPDYWLGGAGYPCRPTVREEVFAFTKPPTVRLLARDRYEIAFAVKGHCDVTVAIEAPPAKDRAPRIVRHLASGVLGRNAPKPFRPDSLSQTLIWDGKDDRGRYVRRPDRCRARVGLGLKASAADVYGWHPKDNTGQVGGLGAGPEGVFVLESGLRPQIRRFDHRGRYVGTVFPPPAATPVTALKGMDLLDLPDGGRVIRVGTYGALLPEWYSDVPTQTIGVARGRLDIGSVGGTVPKKAYRIDVATGGPVDGRMVDLFSERPMTRGQHVALSPDGKWVYVSGLTFREGTRGRRGHAVYRFAWDAPAPLMRTTFFGEDERTGKDPHHVDHPTGVACDARGRVYVADTGNDRIVVLSPDATLIRAVPLKGVMHVAVHHRTGALYALSATVTGPAHARSSTQRIVRLKSPAEPTVEAEVVIPPVITRRASFEPLFCLDSWADPPTVWIKRSRGGLVILADRGDAFEQIADFRKEVAATGIIPGMMYGGRMPKVVADPVRPWVYYHPNGWANATPYRINLVSGRAEQIRLPSPADDIAFGPEGRLYCRAFKCISRHDPETMEEIPFDYGEPVTAGHARFQGAIPLNDMGGAKVYQDGFGVGVDGRIVVVSNIFSWAEFVFQRRGVYDLRASGPGGFDSKENFLRTRERYLADAFRLPVSPGRNVDNQGTVWVYSAKGQLLAGDVIKGPITGTIGAGIDRDGAVYVAANYNKLVDGAPFLPAYVTGTLIKAPLSGARIVGEWSRAKAPLGEKPDRPADFRIFHAAPNTAALRRKLGWVSGADRREIGAMQARRGGAGGPRFWQTGLLWAYPGVSEHVCATGACTCPTNRFGLDYFGRSFVPEAYRYSVGVVDTNGNLVTHIGRYGNADDKGLAFAFPSFLSVIDGILFVSDAGNNRIVRVRLGYHADATTAVPKSPSPK